MILVPAYGGRFQGEPMWERARFWKRGIHNQVLISAFYAMKVHKQDLRQYLELPDSSTLWADSGGYTEMTKGIGADIKALPSDEHSWKNLTELLSFKQLEILKYQEKIGADIAFTFDIPIRPDTPYDKREKLRKITVHNALLALDNRKNKLMKIYAVVHGWDLQSAREMAEELNNFDFDGLAVGGLVPYSSNVIKRVEIIMGVVMGTDMPVHCLGVTGFPHIYSIACLGVNSCDSKTYADYSRFRHYIIPQTGQRVCIGANVKTERRYRFKELPCSCPICLEVKLESKGENYEYESDWFSSGKGRYIESDHMARIALHNLYTYLNEIKLINSAIHDGWFTELLKKKAQVYPELQDTLGFIRRNIKIYPALKNKIEKSLETITEDREIPSLEKFFSIGR